MRVIVCWYWMVLASLYIKKMGDHQRLDRRLLTHWICSSEAENPQLVIRPALLGKIDQQSPEAYLAARLHT